MNKGYFDDGLNKNYSYNVPNYRTSHLKYSQKQISVLNVGMITAGIGFIYLAVLGFILEYLVFKPALYNDSSLANILLIVAVIGIIVGSILSIIWCFRAHKASLAYGFITIFIYTTAYAIGFGSLFTYINFLVFETQQEGLLMIMSVFLFVGFIFIGTFAVSKLLSYKAALTLRKIIMIAIVIAFVALIIAYIYGFLGINNGSYQIIYLVICGLSCIIAVLFLAYDLWLAQNMDKFYDDNQLKLKMGLFIGFQILMNVIMLLWNLLRLISVLKK